MKPSPYDGSIRRAVKQARQAPPHFPLPAEDEDVDKAPHHTDELQTTGSGWVAGMLSNQQRLASSQASEHDSFVSTIQSAWPPSAA